MDARIIRSLAEVDAAEWNALPGAEAPFLRHEFLLALETSGCATAGHGLGCAAHPRAGAGRRAGRCAPAVPEVAFLGRVRVRLRLGGGVSPRGPALLPAPRLGRALHARHRPAAARRRRRAARGPGRGGARARSGRSAFPRCTCCFRGRTTGTRSKRTGLMPRLDCQFHWRNDGYGTFDDFLAGFTAEKRKKLRRERRRVAESGIDCRTLTGADLDDGLIDVDPRPACDDLCAPRPRALPQSRLLRGARARHAREPRGRAREPGRRTRRLRDHAARRGHALRPLLGRERRLPQPAFRALLLPRHRVLHSRGARPLRARHPGRAQAPARLPADGRVVPARDRGPALCRRDRRMARAGAGGRREWLREAATHLPFRRADIPARLDADVRYRLAPED